ncbi:MAG: PLP-dependent transferase, partial [Pseudomonadota bacterium]
AMFEERMAVIEGAQAARATATGMSAMTASLLCQLSAGDHVVAAKALFGSCRWLVDQLLPKFGIQTSVVNGPDLDAWKAAITPQTKLFFFETPANPTLDIVDIAGLAQMAKPTGIKLVVDNVFASPILQKPLSLGADVVAYSATKHIDGQGRCLGGIVLGSNEFVDDHLHNFLRHTGPALSPFNAWVLLKGLETLALRVAAHCRNAALIADALADHPKVERVVFPGRPDHPQAELAAKQMSLPGSLVGFHITDGKDGAFRFMNALNLIRISNNLGDARSLVTHPATTTHHKLAPAERARVGISPGFVRLSVGLEGADDLIADIDRALASV